MISQATSCSSSRRTLRCSWGGWEMNSPYYQQCFLVCRHNRSGLRWFHQTVDSHFFSVLSSSIPVSKLEPELRDSIQSKYGDAVKLVYFNKGLWWWDGPEWSVQHTPSSSCFPLITLNFSSSHWCVMVESCFLSPPLSFWCLNQIGAVVLLLTAGFFCLRNRAVHYFSRLKVMILWR